MPEHLVIIHLNYDGNPELPTVSLRKEITRIAPTRIAVIGTPSKETNQIIDSFKHSGIHVETICRMKNEDEQRLVGGCNVTRFMPSSA